MKITVTKRVEFGDKIYETIVEADAADSFVSSWATPEEAAEMAANAARKLFESMDGEGPGSFIATPAAPA